jgi:hypothetical protein
MKKHLPLLLLLSCSTINGQKRNNLSQKSYSFLYLMNVVKKISYIPNTDKWMASAKSLPHFNKKTNLYPTLSFYTTRLNRTGKPKTLILPSLLKLPVIFRNYVLSGFLTIIPVSFALKHPFLSLSYKYQKLA